MLGDVGQGLSRDLHQVSRQAGPDVIDAVIEPDRRHHAAAGVELIGQQSELVAEAAFGQPAWREVVDVRAEVVDDRIDRPCQPGKLVLDAAGLTAGLDPLQDHSNAVEGLDDAVVQVPRDPAAILRKQPSLELLPGRRKRNGEPGLRSKRFEQPEVGFGKLAAARPLQDQQRAATVVGEPDGRHHYRPDLLVCHRQGLCSATG